jgi:hypothetical protein
MKKIPDLVFHHHTSLGDHFICNGIVHTYAEQLCDRLHLPCHHRYYETISCLYQDFENIIVHPFNDDWPTLEREMFPWAEKNGWPVTRIGFENVYYRNIHRVNLPPEYVSINFDRQFYEQANILFSERYNKFRLPQTIEGCEELYDTLTEGETEYIIVHSNSSAAGGKSTSKDHLLKKGYDIDLYSWRKDGDSNLKVVEIQMGQTSNMLAYMKLIENAKEIHCINSSFFCLVDSVCTKIKAKLFYHDIRINNITQINCWTTGGNRWTVIDYPFKK